jgi:hypothetical protein
MLYVEQPVGTGFSQGVPDIKDENDLAAQLVGFFEQFLEVFKEMKGKKFYLAGESVSIHMIYHHTLLMIPSMPANTCHVSLFVVLNARRR